MNGEALVLDVARTAVLRGYSKCEIAIRVHEEAPVYLRLTVDERSKRVEARIDLKDLREYVMEGLEGGLDVRELVDEILGNVLSLVTELRRVCEGKRAEFSDDFSRARRELLGLLDEVLEEMHQ